LENIFAPAALNTTMSWSRLETRSGMLATLDLVEGTRAMFIRMSSDIETT
jgi:hypothetical protein